MVVYYPVALVVGVGEKVEGGNNTESDRSCGYHRLQQSPKRWSSEPALSSTGDMLELTSQNHFSKYLLQGYSL